MLHRHTALAAVALGLGGCVYAYPVPVDPGWYGAGTSAVVGAGAGALIGSASGDAGTGAAVGAAIGALGGYAIARERQERWEAEQAWRYGPGWW
jgi:hypothetical protein